MQAIHGLDAGDRVALCMKNSPDYLKLLYAVWWFGGIVVPVNNKLHPREVAWIVENSEARLLFSDNGRIGAEATLSAACREIGHGSAGWKALAIEPDADSRPRPVAADDIAWLFYTSGTTGRPKGVMLTHWNLRMMTLAYSLDVD